MFCPENCKSKSFMDRGTKNYVATEVNLNLNRSKLDYVRCWSRSRIQWFFPSHRMPNLPKKVFT